MAAANPVVGEMACCEPSCAVTVYVRKTTTGKLSYSCPRCAGTSFSDAGGLRFRAWTKRMRPVEGADPPAPDDPAPPAPPPAPARQASAFTGLGGPL